VSVLVVVVVPKTAYGSFASGIARLPLLLLLLLRRRTICLMVPRRRNVSRPGGGVGPVGALV
jgi:hypothetical protein